MRTESATELKSWQSRRLQQALCEQTGRARTPYQARLFVVPLIDRVIQTSEARQFIHIVQSDPEVQTIAACAEWLCTTACRKSAKR
jgi:hypothetical protein